MLEQKVARQTVGKRLRCRETMPVSQSYMHSWLIPKVEELAYRPRSTKFANCTGRFQSLYRRLRQLALEWKGLLSYDLILGKGCGRLGRAHHRIVG
ncbi:hypothetical protein DSM25559_4835 [Agrobacterium rosae]|uniref:Uncharacterized protein n=1 Tax=Agrobacterium rosae TaxID=1972867 RepID=A0A1R3U962_9HYPH|nr:hypothetical protein DSM25559_4835 [Agrobacterium rosae]